MRVERGTKIIVKAINVWRRRFTRCSSYRIQEKSDVLAVGFNKGSVSVSVVVCLLKDPKILQFRLQSLAEDILPESQCGFRANRSTQDMIFTLRQLQENH